jgi:hypothetical protein
VQERPDAAEVFECFQRQVDVARCREAGGEGAVHVAARENRAALVHDPAEHRDDAA